MSTFFGELRQRKVYRAAAAYAIFGWLLIQIAAIAFPAWDLPQWSLRVLMLSVLIGFPIALILGWAFDLTPSGLRTVGTPPVFRSRRNVYLLAGLGAAISLALGFFILPRVAGRPLEKTIAVLPFANLSEEKENAYFADGIQDDLLTRLAKIGDLKVISRTSVMEYRGNPHNVRDIAKALGVGAILEGSVRRIGNRVRVTVQLINAANDHHLWAEEYDRELTDVFAIQSDLATEIAGQLQAKLAPDEQALLQQRPTANGQAYMEYLQGHDHFTRPDESGEDMLKAEKFYERAIELDPQFALAFAQFSRLESWLYHTEASPARLDKARAAAGEAIRLQPDLPEAHLALGYCYYYGERNYERAMQEFATAQRGLPNEADIYVAIGAIKRRQGKWKECLSDFEKAVSLDPRNAIHWETLGATYNSLRNYPAAARAFSRGAAVAPESLRLSGLVAGLDFDWKGDIVPLKSFLEKLPADIDLDGQITLARAQLLLLERKFTDALAVIQNSKVDAFQTDSPVKLPRPYVEARIYALIPDAANARAAFERAFPVAEAAVSEAPDNPFRRVLLSKVYAGLGRNEESIREGKKAVELLPESVDALDGPTIVAELAETYMLVGEADAAIDLIEHSLRTPNGITLQRLRVDPVWDPLRKNAHFQRVTSR